MMSKNKIQSVLIKKKYYTFEDASYWILKNGFKIGRVDITKNLYRFRQIEPKKGAKYRIKKISSKISFVMEIN